MILFADDGARPCDTSCCGDKGGSGGGKGTKEAQGSTTNGASGASSQKLWYFLYVVCGIVGLLYVEQNCMTVGVSVLVWGQKKVNNIFI